MVWAWWKDCSSASSFLFLKSFVVLVKLCYNNPGYTLFSRYLKNVIILDIVILGENSGKIFFFGRSLLLPLWVKVLQ